jgi:hypothetical protein
MKYHVKKVLVLLPMLIMLTGCKEDSNQQMYVKQVYSIDDCDVKWVYNPDNYNFYIAKCPGNSTTTTYWSGGKSDHPVSVIQTANIEELRKQLAEAEAKEKVLQKLTADEKKVLGIE